MITPAMKHVSVYMAQDRLMKMERLLDFCDMNGLVVCNTIFAQKDIDKYIWVSPGKRTENKINQIMINKRWRRSVIYARTYIVAEVDSDQILLCEEKNLKAMKKVEGQRTFVANKT